MSVADSTGDGAGLVSRLRGLEMAARGAISVVLRPARRRTVWPSSGRIALAAAGSLAAILLTMAALDHPLLAAAQRLPRGLIDAFNDFTDFGRSGWFLWPIGLLLVALLLLDSPAMRRFDRAVLAAFAVRLGFVFTAIALPGLFFTILKRLIGRARPFVGGDSVWNYMPFVWKPEYASFPSGHATTAFAALVAIGALFPQARALMWIYAVLIAVSRVVIVAHHPSDVLAGAIVGALGALLVRDWFAARGRVFTVGRDGAVRPMPGPNGRRIVKAVARRLRTA